MTKRNYRPLGPILPFALTVMGLALAILGGTAGCGFEPKFGLPPGSETERKTASAPLQASPLFGGMQAPGVLSESAILILDEDSKPIPGAEILIGSMDGVPFSGNRLKTGTDGKAVLPNLWTAEQPVTIQASGFVRTTYLSQVPGGRSYQLRRSPIGDLTLTGVSNGFGAVPSNGNLDASLVFPAVSQSQLGTLDITRLLSPEVDHQTVYGQDISIPANLSIPDQSESIFLFVSVNLNKPQYRVGLPGGVKPSATVAALGAQVDFKQTVSDLKAGKSFFDLINGLRFRSYSVRAVQTPASSVGLTLGLDIPINEIPIQTGPTIQSGTLPTGYAVVATALTNHGGAFVVTDVKRLFSGEQRQLGVSYNGQASFVVRTLKKYEPTRVDFSGSDYEELSSITLPANQTPSADYLSIVAPPKTVGRTLSMAPPALPASTEVTGTRVTLSGVQLLKKGAVNLVAKTPLWDFWSPAFAAKIDLPSMGQDPWSQKGQYRWELSYGARPIGSALTTHVTRASVDFLF